MCGHPLYGRWYAMLHNCGYLSKSPENYNARRTYSGVEVHPDWVASFDKYVEDVTGLGWREGMTVARRHKEKGFIPGNIVVSHGKIDSQNYLRNRGRLVRYGGKEMSLRDVIRRVRPDADWNLVNQRVVRGWDVLRAITEPARKGGRERNTDENLS